jgi:hypothetical protein
MKINDIITRSQEISAKFVDMPNHLTIKAYCNFNALPDWNTYRLFRREPEVRLFRYFLDTKHGCRKNQAIIMPILSKPSNVSQPEK